MANLFESERHASVFLKGKRAETRRRSAMPLPHCVPSELLGRVKRDESRIGGIRRERYWEHHTIFVLHQGKAAAALARQDQAGVAIADRISSSSSRFSRDLPERARVQIRSSAQDGPIKDKA